MDQKKIGLFVASCRKAKGFTQKQLADLLNVSDKSVSKWERGINLPDASLYMPLCEILEIGIDEFFLGEYNIPEKEKSPLSLEKLKQEYKKNLRIKRWEFVLLFISIISVFLSKFVWQWNLTWLSGEPGLEQFSNMFYLTYLYFIAYILIYKRIRIGYSMIWFVFGVLSTGIIAFWGYNFQIILSNIDFWINLTLTIFGFYKHDLSFNYLMKKKHHIK